MIAVGEKIDTNFELKVVENGEDRLVNFGELLDTPAIVTVYMKNNTSSCDLQNTSICGFEDAIPAKGFKLIALSKDGVKGHKNYAKKHDLKHILASDPDHKFAAATDSIVEKKMYGKVYSGPSRSAFAIGTDGTVLAVIEKVNSKEHGAELVDLVNAL